MSKLGIAVIAALGLLTACGEGQTDNGSKSECGSNYISPNINALNSDLNAAKSRWAAANISNYSYLQLVTSLVGATTKVMVRGGQVTATEVMGSPRPYEPGQTMEGLFAQVAQGIAAATQAKSCLMVSATYDPQDGHLLTAVFNNNLKNVTDTYVSYTITDFKKE